MDRLAILQESGAGAEQLCGQMAGIFEIELKQFDEMGRGPPGPYTVVDFDLNDISRLTALKQWLAHKPRNAKVIFAADKGSRLQEVQALAIGATDILPRPLNAKSLLAKLWGDVATLSR